MATIANLNVLLSLQDDLTGKMRGVSNKLDSIGKSFRSFGTKMTAGVTLPIVGAGIAFTNWASDLDETISKTDKLFTTSSAAVMDWSKDSVDALFMTQNQALEFAGFFGGMLQTVADGPKELANMSTALVDLTADFASFHNLNPEEAFTVISSALAGETEAIRRYGVDVSAAAVEQKALSMGLADTAANLTEQDKALARYNLIMEQTAVLQGDAADTADSLSNRVKRLTARFKQIGTDMGRIIVPYAIELADKLEKVMQWFEKLSPSTQRWIIIIAGLAATLGPLLVALGFMAQGLAALIPLFGLVMSPVLLLVAAGAALAFVFRDELMGALDGVLPMLGDIGTAISDLLGDWLGFGDTVTKATEPLHDAHSLLGEVGDDLLGFGGSIDGAAASADAATGPLGAAHDAAQNLIRVAAGNEPIGDMSGAVQGLADSANNVQEPTQGAVDKLRDLADKLDGIPYVGWLAAGAVDGVATAIATVGIVIGLAQGAWDTITGVLDDMTGKGDDASTSIDDVASKLNTMSSDDTRLNLGDLGRKLTEIWVAAGLLAVGVRLAVWPFSTLIGMVVAGGPVTWTLAAALGATALMLYALKTNLGGFHDKSVAAWDALQKMADTLILIKDTIVTLNQLSPSGLVKAIFGLGDEPTTTDGYQVDPTQVGGGNLSNNPVDQPAAPSRTSDSAVYNAANSYALTIKRGALSAVEGMNAALLKLATTLHNEIPPASTAAADGLSTLGTLIEAQRHKDVYGGAFLPVTNDIQLLGRTAGAVLPVVTSGIQDHAAKWASIITSRTGDMQQRASDRFRQMQTDGTSAVSSMATSVGNHAATMATNVGARFSGMASATAMTMLGMKVGAIAQAQATGSGISNAIGSGAQSALSRLGSAMGSMAPTILGASFGAIATAYSVGSNIGNAVASGIESAMGRVAAAAASIINTANGAMVAAAMIHSPSKLFMEHGRMIGEGLALGIAGSEGRVAAATAALVNVPGTTAGGQGGVYYDQRRFYALRQDEYAELINDAREGGDFARGFGGNIGMSGGRV